MSFRVAVVLRMPLLMSASALQPDTRASRKVQALHTDQQCLKCMGRNFTLGCELPRLRGTHNGARGKQYFGKRMGRRGMQFSPHQGRPLRKEDCVTLRPHSCRQAASSGAT